MTDPSIATNDQIKDRLIRMESWCMLEAGGYAPSERMGIFLLHGTFYETLIPDENGLIDHAAADTSVHAKLRLGDQRA